MAASGAREGPGCWPGRARNRLGREEATYVREEKTHVRDEVRAGPPDGGSVAACRACRAAGVAMRPSRWTRARRHLPWIGGGECRLTPTGDRTGRRHTRPSATLGDTPRRTFESNLSTAPARPLSEYRHLAAPRDPHGPRTPVRPPPHPLARALAVTRGGGSEGHGAQQAGRLLAPQTRAGAGGGGGLAEELAPDLGRDGPVRVHPHNLPPPRAGAAQTQSLCI